MSTSAIELYVSGLKNAHALEKQAVQIINRQLEQLENYPEVEALLRRHLGETETQIGRIDEILAAQDETPSVLKDIATSLSGNMAALSHTIMDDEILKNHFVNHAFENFEIASYLSLIAIAEASGRSRDVPALEATLGEERRTAQALHDMTGDLSRKYLSRIEGGQKADR